MFLAARRQSSGSIGIGDANRPGARADKGNRFVPRYQSPEEARETRQGEELKRIRNYSTVLLGKRKLETRAEILYA